MTRGRLRAVRPSHRPGSGLPHKGNSGRILNEFNASRARHRNHREKLMRLLATYALVIAVFTLTIGSTQAKPLDLRQWFLDATAFNAPGASTAIAAPDFLGGKRQIEDTPAQSLCDADYGAGLPSIYALWNLLAYDRKDHLGLAAPHDDADGCALFKASTPAWNVADADLSQSATERGLRIGSSYAQVLSIYGPPVKHGRHFVTTYRAAVPGKTRHLPYKPVMLHERITIVIDDDRVSSILIFINESGLY